MDSRPKEYLRENDEVFKYVVNDMYLETWKESGNSHKKKGLELIVSRKCNLGCKYCYMHNFGHKLYPESIHESKSILKHTAMVVDWLIENKYKPPLDLFSGEFFGQQLGYDVLDLIYDKYKEAPEDSRLETITVPTNFTFVHDEALSARVEKYLNDFRDLGIDLHLSSSFDGKHMEENRPYFVDMGIKLNKPRDDEYYDKVFRFIKRNRCGLHPMVYSENIEKWKDNFLWFQEMMAKNDIPWNKIYLLQVRNAEWTVEQAQELRKFVVWLTEWIMEKLNGDKDKFIDLINEYPYGFNILKSIHGKSNRGLPCSIQQALVIRLGDLSIVPCHRLMYPGQEYGKLIIEDDKIKDITSINTEMMIAVLSCDYRSQPYCVSCGIRDLCTGGCLGSQFEITGDPFTPIPSMCMMQHALTTGVIEGQVKVGVFRDLLTRATEEQRIQMIKIREELSDYGI